MVNKDNYEEYMLLYADGELSEAEVKALLAFVDQHPELCGELEAYNSTRLVPDTNIVFANKDSLMKSSGGGKVIGLGKWWMYAAAACVLLFAVLIINNNNTTTIDSTSVAIKQESKTDPTITPDTTKEIHSMPVSPVVHENAIARKENAKRPTLNPEKQVAIPQPETPHEAVAHQEKPQQPEVQPTLIQPQHEEPAPIAKAEPQHLPVTEQPSANEAITTQVLKEKKGILAWLPIKKEKTEGLTTLGDVVNEKIEKIKEVKNNIKDSEVSFKIGNKELFIVRL